EEHPSDSAPTQVRAVVPGGLAPVPLAQRTLPPSIPPAVPDAWPARISSAPSRALLVPALLALAVCGGGVVAFVRMRRETSSSAPAVPAGMSTLHFLGMPEGARAVVGATPYYSDTAIVPRGSSPTRVRIEAPGYIPFDFTI